MNQPPENPNADIAIFEDDCVFMWSIYLHYKILFEDSTEEDKAQMSRAAKTLFGHINIVFVEYIILQVCKITDPAQDPKKNDNLTIPFLVQHYDFSDDPATMQRLKELKAWFEGFRCKLLPARNKLIAHADRNTIMAGKPLGEVPQSEWDEFWVNLQKFVCIIHEKVCGETFQINKWAWSDADKLLNALKHSACLDEC